MEPGLVGKCFLRFPSIPFIPRAPYDVIATDYDNYAVVSGAKGTTFVQVSVTTAAVKKLLFPLWKIFLSSLNIPLSIFRRFCTSFKDSVGGLLPAEIIIRRHLHLIVAVACLLRPSDQSALSSGLL
jgi:hypothetical protein